MFYYLLYNSSFLKKKTPKDKFVFTLIGGSLVYLISHALVSTTCKNEILKYIWFLLLIDISAVLVSSDFEGFSSVQFNQITPPTILNIKSNEIEDEIYERKKEQIKDAKKKTILSQTNDESEHEIPEILTSKSLTPKNKKTKKKKYQNSKTKEIKSILKQDKKVSFDDSTDIQTIKSNIETYNAEEANSINLTLESLKNLQLKIEDNSNDNFPTPRKKLEDEYSDIGSELDLAKFEDSIKLH